MDHLHIDRAGTGPEILLLAGNGGLTGFWTGVWDGLTAGYTVTAFDYRDAPPWDGEAPFETIARKISDAQALWDANGVTRCSVVAHSSGVHAAIALAAAHPERIEKIVLSGGWAGPSPYVSESFGLRKKILKTMGTEAFLADGVFRAMPPALLMERLKDQDIASLAGFRGGVDEDLESARIDMILTADSRAILPSVTCPALVLSVADDTVFPPALAEELVSLLPDAKAETLPTGGHLSPMLAPDAWLEAVTAFLDEARHD